MGKRSLKTSSVGQEKARRAFERTQWTQEQLAYEVGLNTRQSVWKFLSGRPIERHIFIDLCFQLNLDWQEIADLPSNQPQPVLTNGEASLAPALPTAREQPPEALQQLRHYLQPAIAQQCGILQSSLDVGRPHALEDLYTPIRIVPQLTHQRWLDMSDLQPAIAAGPRIQLAHAHPEAIDAMTVIATTPKVLIFGKPGSGKTTFLKYVAQQCLAAAYRPDCVPIFIPLRHGLPLEPRAASLSIAGLKKYFADLAHQAGLTDSQMQGLLQQGQFLLLLDGLDEVPSRMLHEVLRDLQNFTQTYPHNPCLLTTRLTHDLPYLPGFVTVEVDDFSRDQIQTFVQRWFKANLADPETAQQKTQHFLEALDTAENQPLKELVSTPILLSLLCSVFLARSDFPKQRAKLYQAGLDILLERWDQARGIQRDQVYRHLEIADKLGLLGTIAATTFAQGRYFFEKSELLAIITHYLQVHPQGATTDETSDLETRYLASDAILKSIQIQHGLIVERAKDIYSFSHLTFQEYLTARKMLYQTTTESPPATIQALAAHTLEPAWHEVLRLMGTMMPIADPLLTAMHESIRSLLQAEAGCQQYLAAIARKVDTLESERHPAALRAFYFTLFRDRDLRLAASLDHAITYALEPELALDLALARTWEMGESLLHNPALKPMLNLTFALELDQKFTLQPAFQAAFEALKQQLPDVEMAPEGLRQWWQEFGEQWLDTFQTLLIDHRQIGQFRRLSPREQVLLHQYYQLLVYWVDCSQESATTAAFTHLLSEAVLRP